MSLPPLDPIPVLADLPLVIETPRLRLRPFVETDVPDLFAYARDPELSQFVTWAAHRDEKDTREFVLGRIAAVDSGTDVAWAIEHDGHARGCITLVGIRWMQRATRVDRAELAYWLGKPLWGAGLMTEAAVAVTRWGFDALGLHKITIGCLEPNIGSRRVIEKVGFRYLCKQEDDFWRDGRWHAHLRYELLSSEWGDTARTLRFSRPSRP
jgi:ribosomal-protein-alanine N-acetyltransferase